MKVKRVSRKYEVDGDRVLGEYYRDKDTIVLYTREIKASAKEHGHDPADLETMVELHELGHRAMRLGKECTLTLEQEEQAADLFAFWNFLKREGRYPAVNLAAWRST